MSRVHIVQCLLGTKSNYIHFFLELNRTWWFIQLFEYASRVYESKVHGHVPKRVHVGFSTTWCFAKALRHFRGIACPAEGQLEPACTIEELGGGTNPCDVGLDLSGSWQQGHSATYNAPSRI